MITTQDGAKASLSNSPLLAPPLLVYGRYTDCASLLAVTYGHSMQRGGGKV